MHNDKEITMKELIIRVWEYAVSHVAAHDQRHDPHEEESWLGI